LLFLGYPSPHPLPQGERGAVGERKDELIYQKYREKSKKGEKLGERIYGF